MERDNKGIAIINVVLLIFIIICSAFIGMVITQSNGQANKIGEKENEVRNSVVKSKTNSNKNEYAERSNTVVNVGDSNVSTRKETSEKKYYYKQLNNVAKIMYETIENNIGALKTGKQSIKFDIDSGEAGDYFQSAWDAFTLDRPDIFWVDTLKLAVLTRTTTNIFSATSYEYTLEPREGAENYYVDSFSLPAQVDTAIEEVESKIEQIANGATGNTYDKVKYVHDYIVDLITYDQTGKINNSNIYGALIERTCVCEGYAESFKLILDKLNIPCIIVYGDGIDSNGRTEAHAWNYVKMEDDKWYAVDATWDDPIIIGNGSSLGIDRHKYFLKGSGDFSQTHTADGDVSGQGQVFVYPELSYTNYE